MCLGCYQPSGSLLHCLSTLTRSRSYRPRAVYFCCTGLGVASTGRYPASCPVKPGLSSPAAFRRLQLRLSVLLADTSNISHLGFKNNSKIKESYHDIPSSTIRSFPSAAPVASSSHRSFWGCPLCPFTQINFTL